MLRKMLLASVLVAGVTAPVAADEASDFVVGRSLSLDLALDLAKATLQSCRDGGYQVAVAVVDRGGNLQVMLRDQFAGPHTTSTARRKAWTALSFRTDTSTMAVNTQAGKPQSGVRHVDNMLALGGGIMIRSKGDLVGAIGVSGAPGGDLDDACAAAAIEALEDRLEPL
jgi:uncharacterized protein GlcG (DUF336 family)